MGLRMIENKFKALEKREKELYEYFDVTRKHKRQHPWIEDIKEDFKLDLQNFGKSRFRELFPGITSARANRRRGMKT
jgi:predicted dithiol-disulfide oxidoreductase (DUF899 family)